MGLATVNRRRSEEISRLIQAATSDASRKNRRIETVDPILRAGKTLYPTMPHRELLEYAQTALRVILSEPQSPTYQTTLLIHM
ncbi:hypothetical protein A3K69_07645 [Candidatus Bathyarchaeota archaeon RBG_16_57_9]|nr:MAG: hypothetical protein A3K69_07645 [Candidatus Bathyarchaeota archaeon RBG_16_57_9]